MCSRCRHGADRDTGTRLPFGSMSYASTAAEEFRYHAASQSVSYVQCPLRFSVNSRSGSPAGVRPSAYERLTTGL
jgi:hypothetical protein